jgi:hypothetical protein
MKQRVVLGLVTTALAAGIIAPPVEAAPLLFIRGRVTSVTGQALGSARVSMTSRAVYTTQDGRYELGTDLPGCYQVTASGVTPNGAYESSTREICTTTQDAINEDFSLSLAVDADASPTYLSGRSESGPLIEAAIYCPPTDCELEAEVRQGSATGPIVTTVPLGAAAKSEEFWLYSSEVAMDAISVDSLYVARVTARVIGSGASASRCSADRCLATFAVDGQPPSIQMAGNGWHKTRTPSVAVNYSDSAGISPDSIRVHVDEAAVPWTRDGSTNLGQISFSPTLAEGSHIVDVRITDGVGNEAVHRSELWVDLTNPQVSDPKPQGRVTTRSPTISAVIEDAPSVGSVLPGSVRLRLSNALLSADLAADFEPASGRVTYSVPSSVQGATLGAFPLPDGDYVVEVSAADMAGNPVSKQWTFTVDSLLLRIRLLPI